ncbi:hypothetical protein [Symmachiella dynata]|uniref:hypothetical protein n=1 Tax=Symmachiella dynata TaxID=2527995 RepID=UPI0011A0145E|nr:hypothetical protein [Symmachiella dynata]
MLINKIVLMSAWLQFSLARELPISTGFVAWRWRPQNKLAPNPGTVQQHDWPIPRQLASPSTFVARNFSASESCGRIDSLWNSTYLERTHSTTSTPKMQKVT